MVDQVILPVLGPTILEIILNLGENLGFSEVASFLELTGVSQEIDDPTDGPFTVFAPSNEAFEALDPYFLDYLGNNLDVVALILHDHAVPGVITAEQLVAQDPPEAIFSALGEKIQPIVVNGQVFLQATNTDPDNLPMVGPVDIEASNGIVHIIDQLLLGSISAGATAALKGFTLFTAAVEAAGLTEQFNSIASLSTVFLRTDGAFLALGDATLNAVLSDPRLLTRILETHVIPDLGLTSTAILGAVEAGQSTLVSESGVTLEAVLDGDMLFVAAGGNQGLGAQVVEVDIPAFNSVIHVIDTVLLPPTIAQVVENLGDEFSTLLGALQGTRLITSIDEPTDEVLTAFAPTNAAFAQLGSFLDYLTDNPDILFMVVQGHAFINETNTTEMVSETPAAVLRSFANSIRPLKQDDGSIDLITFNNPRDNLPTIIEPFDIVASNGIVHAIDRVILPLLPVAATAVVRDFSTFVAAVEAADLTSLLNSQAEMFTVFVPTNEAFATVEGLVAILNDKVTLTEILLTHVINGTALTSSQIVAAIEGGTTSVPAASGVPLSATLTGTDLFVAGPGNEAVGAAAQVTRDDLPAWNSWMHVVDTVLLP